MPNNPANEMTPRHGLFHMGVMDCPDPGPGGVPGRLSDRPNIAGSGSFIITCRWGHPRRIMRPGLCNVPETVSKIRSQARLGVRLHSSQPVPSHCLHSCWEIAAERAAGSNPRNLQLGARFPIYRALHIFANNHSTNGTKRPFLDSSNLPGCSKPQKTYVTCPRIIMMADLRRSITARW